MTYTDYLTTAEINRWIIDTDIDWDSVNPQLALSQPELLDRVRDSALIESFFPIYTPRALDLLWDNVTATAIYSVQLYESYKHFQVFNQYLELIDYHPITDDEIVDLRRKNLKLNYSSASRLLTRYMMSEHFAAHAFFKDSKAAADPVLKSILHLVAKDEVRHCQFGLELLEDQLKRHPEEIDDCLDEALNFRHIGELVVDEMPVAEKNDLAAIIAVNRKIERITGRKINNYVKELVA